MRSCLLAACAGVAFLSFAGAAAAVEVPKAGQSDPRVKWVNYDPWQVYRVIGTFRTATQIVFDSREEIQHVALGDTVSWEVAAETNILFVKPREKGMPTNLIVTTRRGSELRNYTFELGIRSGPITATSPDTYFQVRFKYPDDERAALVRTIVGQAAAIEGARAGLMLDHAVVEGPRNLNYTVQGSSRIQPSEVSDNGQFTVLRFPANQELPSFFMTLPDGSESQVPFDVRDEFVVLHTVATKLVLRRGREVLCIFNEAVTPYGVTHGTGTASSNVDRTIRTGQ
ncbi:TrbG/VirB9 family P-type conjugative transfer protein [Caulobacter henricii]|uniref:Conjugal transfer protein n=1 Tax=Caulobacter henricii TaxID=69395 RepID=A0A0P0P4M2_9CAUL|nr:TrbG/VirB9 family P-type conjugative transfer protein [Caulobacter henricii]ALL15453.1 conjugal transfer protein [Caulobacter henricii]